MNKNQKLLEEFTAYCNAHPEERFWQALRNWSRAANIFWSNGALLRDTFYLEDKTPWPTECGALIHATANTYCAEPKGACRFHTS